MARNGASKSVNPWNLVNASGNVRPFPGAGGGGGVSMGGGVFSSGDTEQYPVGSVTYKPGNGSRTLAPGSSGGVRGGTLGIVPLRLGGGGIQPQGPSIGPTYGGAPKAIGKPGGGPIQAVGGGKPSGGGVQQNPGPPVPAPGPAPSGGPSGGPISWFGPGTQGGGQPGGQPIPVDPGFTGGGTPGGGGMTTTSSSPGFFAAIPWWGWLAAAAGAYYLYKQHKKGRRR